MTGMMQTVPSALLRARDLVDPALRRAIDGLTQEIRRVVGYHLGFVDRDGRPSRADGGKALRPALALLSAEAVGSAAEVALPGAVAVELVHNFSLLHDDVMDQDMERRHRPTAWALFGVGRAIVTGDALMVLAQDVLMDGSTRGDRPERWDAAAAVARATAEMIAGQAEDLAFESRLDVSVNECLRMTAHKTGALLSCASSIGAILAGADSKSVDALAGFGLHLGLAFQAVDDILGIWGHPDVTGKPAANDLRAHKKTLPVVMALSSSGEDRDRLFEVLSNGTLTDASAANAADLVDRCGGREAAQAEAERQLELALRSLRGVSLDPAARGELEQIAAFVTARDF
jgi:geranylgeranyl diphosphate synthase type I